MAGIKISQTDARRISEAIAKNRRSDGSINVTRVAKACNVARQTAQYHVDLFNKGDKRFISPKLPSSSRSLDEIKIARRIEGERTIAADYARDLIKIPIKIDGPIGILAFGDPHLDDPGCDYALLESHMEIARRNPAVFAIDIGDVTNNWIGRLTRLYADQTTTAKEAWMLAEDFFTSLDWLAHIAGNHDVWSGAGDPLHWFAKQMGTIYEPDGVRIALEHPCGNTTRIHARHAFPGTSQWNKSHGMTKEVMIGFRDHLLLEGHFHSGGDTAVVTADGPVAQLVKLSGYKVADKYRHTLGFKRSPIHPAAMIILDPREYEGSRARTFVAPTPEIGEVILKALRAEYERDKVKSKSPKRKAR